jgi:hypothetical protein
MTLFRAQGIVDGRGKNEHIDAFVMINYACNFLHLHF